MTRRKTYQRKTYQEWRQLLKPVHRSGGTVVFEVEPIFVLGFARTLFDSMFEAVKSSIKSTIAIPEMAFVIDVKNEDRALDVVNVFVGMDTESVRDLYLIDIGNSGSEVVLTLRARRDVDKIRTPEEISRSSTLKHSLMLAQEDKSIDKVGCKKTPRKES